MASTRRIEAGAAFIRVAADDKEFLKAIDKMARRLSRFGNQMAKFGAAFGAAGAGLGAPLAVFGREAASAETALRRFNLIFDDTAKDMRSALKDISESTGVSMVTLIRNSSAFGAIFAEMRDTLGDKAFVDVVTNTQQAILDLAAVSGEGIAEASDRMKSAFTSTGEAVDQYGINIRKANLEQEAITIGLNKSILTMTEQEKQLLKLSAIMRQFSRTNISFVNLVDTLNGQFTLFIENMKQIAAELGFVLVKVLTPFVRQLNVMLLVMRPLAKLLSPFVALLAPLAGGLLAIGGLLTGVGLLSKFVGFVASGISPLVTGLAPLAQMVAVLGPRGALAVGLAKITQLFNGLLLIAVRFASILRGLAGGFLGGAALEAGGFRVRGLEQINAVRKAQGLPAINQGTTTIQGLKGLLTDPRGFLRSELAKRRGGAGGGGAGGGAAGAISGARSFLRGPISPQAAFGITGGGASTVADLGALWESVISNGKVKVTGGGAS